jgi:hypothetical protein
MISPAEVLEALPLLENVRKRLDEAR